MANGNGNGDYGDIGYSAPMPVPAAAIYPPNQLITPPTPTQTASAAAPSSVLPPTPPPGPIEDWNWDQGLGRWVKNITPPQTASTQPNTSDLHPSATATPPAPVQPTRFDMGFGDSVVTQQLTNRYNPRITPPTNRVWGVEGPQYNGNNPAPFDPYTTAAVGDPPKRIADRAEYQIQNNPDYFKTDANGRPINNIFASIGSNNPTQLDDVGRFIDTVKKSNPNARIVIPGMGPGVKTPNIDAANAALKQVVESHGGIFFQPNIQWADGVHPAHSGQMFDQANSALANAVPPAPASRVSATATGTIPGEGLPQPGQQQPSDNAIAPQVPLPKGVSAPVLPPTNTPPDLAPLINYWADYAGVDRNIFARMIGHESSFRKDAVGSTPAEKGGPEIGLGQLMPATAAEMNVKDSNDPSENLRGSAQYLRKMLDNPRADGDYRKALQLYNHGPGNAHAFDDFNYADAVLTGEQRYGYRSGQKIPGTSMAAGGVVGNMIPQPQPVTNNPLVPPGGTAGQAGAGARGARPDGPDYAAIAAQNERMRRLAIAGQLAQQIANMKPVDPATLESGYDPRKVLAGGDFVPRPYSVSVGTPPRALQMPRFSAELLPQRGPLPVESFTTSARGRTLRKGGEIEEA